MPRSCLGQQGGTPTPAGCAALPSLPRTKTAHIKNTTAPELGAMQACQIRFLADFVDTSVEGGSHSNVGASASDRRHRRRYVPARTHPSTSA